MTVSPHYSPIPSRSITETFYATLPWAERSEQPWQRVLTSYFRQPRDRNTGTPVRRVLACTVCSREVLARSPKGHNCWFCRLENSLCNTTLLYPSGWLERRRMVQCTPRTGNPWSLCHRRRKRLRCVEESLLAYAEWRLKPTHYKSRIFKSS